MMKPQDLEVYTLTGVIGLGAAAGVYLLVRNKVKDAQQTNIQQSGLDAGTAANFAKRLKMAFDNDNPLGWGTDEQAVYGIFNELPTKSAYAQVQKAYKTLYSEDLNADLQSEMSSADFVSVMKIYNSKRA